MNGQEKAEFLARELMGWFHPKDDTGEECSDFWISKQENDNTISPYNSKIIPVDYWDPANCIDQALGDRDEGTVEGMMFKRFDMRLHFHRTGDSYVAGFSKPLSSNHNLNTVASKPAAVITNAAIVALGGKP